MANSTTALVTTKDALAQLNALLPEANAGDQQALVQMRAVLDAHPELWKRVGDMAAVSEQTLVRALGGANTVQRDAVLRQLRGLRRELSGPAPTPLERLLVDRVVLGWLGLAYAEGTYHAAIERGLSWRDDEFHQKRVERAQRRYLAAIKALAQVRRLGVPAVQINIADQQINVAG